MDATMTENYKTDIGKLAYVGKQGVLCLLSESIYAEKQGYTSPNNRVASFIREVLLKNENRIIATVTPAHFYRIQEIFDEAEKNGFYEIKISAKDNPLIDEKVLAKIDDGVDLYVEYLKSGVAQEINLDLIKNIKDTYQGIKL